jgi:chromosome partitioning protein
MVVSFINGDGGARKTTTAASIATILASEGLKILLVDVTHKRHLTHMFMSDRDLPQDQTILCVLENNCELEHGKTVHSTDIENIDIICGDEGLEYLSGFQYELFLREKLQAFADKYDHVFVDTANHGLLLDLAISVSDSVIVSVKPTKESLYGAIEAIERTRRLERKHDITIKVLEVILSGYSKNDDLSLRCLTELKGEGDSSSRFMFLAQYFNNETVEGEEQPKHVVQFSKLIPKLQFNNQNIGVIWGWLNVSKQLKRIAQDLFMY